MRIIAAKLSILAFAILTVIAIGFSGCEKDTEVIPKTLEEYMADLSEIIAQDKPLVENCVVGYNKYDFKNDLLYIDFTETYMSALLDAEAVLEDPEVKIADVIKTNQALSQPGDNFHDNIWISDRRPLQALIVECDTLRVHTPIGSEPGMAPEVAHSEFLTAINAAKAVRGRSTTIDRQVQEAVDELNPELDKFEEAIIK